MTGTSTSTSESTHTGSSKAHARASVEVTVRQQQEQHSGNWQGQTYGQNQSSSHEITGAFAGGGGNYYAHNSSSLYFGLGALYAPPPPAPYYNTEITGADREIVIPDAVPLGPAAPLEEPVGQGTRRVPTCPATAAQEKTSAPILFQWGDKVKGEAVLRPGQEKKLAEFVNQAIEGFNPECEKLEIQVDGRRCANKGEIKRDDLDNKRAKMTATLIQQQLLSAYGQTADVSIGFKGVDTEQSNPKNLNDKTNASAVVRIKRSSLESSE